MEEYYLFLDETGNHSLQLNNTRDIIFGLCGVLCKKSEYKNIICPKINIIKKRHWPPDGKYKKNPVIFHHYDIKNSRGPFFLKNSRPIFFKDLKNLIIEIPITIFGILINKQKLNNSYKRPENPYNLSLEFIIERIFYYLKNKNNGIVKKVIAESRGFNEDNALKETYSNIQFNGTRYIKNKELINLFPNEIIFKKKLSNVEGLQIADLCAYPLRKYLENQNDDAWRVVESKLYHNNNSNYLGYGLKLFP